MRPWRLVGVVLAVGAALLAFVVPVLAALAALGAGACLFWGREEPTQRQALPAANLASPQAGLAALTPLLEALPDPALLIDASGRIAGSNGAARRELQFEAAGLFLSALLRQPDLLDAAQAAAHDGASRTIEYQTAAPVEQHTRCYIAPVTWGDARAALMVFHDQTARINTERMRADFLANASHELRTPVASISLLIETLLGPARDNAEDRDRFLAMMGVQADRMRRLIDDLLSLSRIELDEHVPPSDRANLAMVAHEVVDSLRPMARGREVSLEIEAAENASVIGARYQLAQVLQNLIDNAIKYTPPGGAVTIEVGRANTREETMALCGKRWDEAGRLALLTPPPSTQSRGYAYVRVTDTGPGIARRFLPRLGERFYRVERELGNERGGTGLGLAIVKHIINRHRGGLMVESEPGRGSAFAAYIELAGEAGTRPKLEPAPAHPAPDAS